MKIYHFPLFIVAAALFTSTSGADPITWTGDANDGGNFLTPENWTDGTVPGSDDIAVFDQNGTVTVFFPEAEGTYSINGIDYVSPASGTGILDIDLGGRTLASATALPRLNTAQNNTAGPTQTLIFRNGSVTAPSWTISNLAIQHAVRWSEVQLDNVSLNLSGDFVIGYWNRADVYVSNGSSVTVSGYTSIGTLDANANFGGRGNVFIDGPDSSFNAARTTLGQRGGHGTMTITNGGSFVSSENLQLGRRWDNESSRDATGTVTVDGTDSSASAVNFYIGGGNGNTSTGGTLAGDGTGTGIFTNGGTGTFTSMRVFYTDLDDIITRGTLAIGGGQVSVSSNAVFERGAIFRVGLNDPSQAASLLVGGNLSLNEVNLRGTTDIAGTFLELLLPVDFAPNDYDTFVIVEYSGSLTGNFLWGTDLEDYTVLLEDSTFTAGDQTFRINYAVESGDSLAITLTVVPEPSSVAVVIGALSLALMLVRRHAMR